MKTKQLDWTWDKYKHPSYPDTNMALLRQTRRFLLLMKVRRLRANSEGTKSKVFSS